MERNELNKIAVYGKTAHVHLLKDLILLNLSYCPEWHTN